jgi:hypothetical protein
LAGEAFGAAEVFGAAFIAAGEALACDFMAACDALGDGLAANAAVEDRVTMAARAAAERIRMWCWYSMM